MESVTNQDAESRNRKLIYFIIISLVGILVYMLAGYNYFMDVMTKLIVKVTVSVVLFLTVMVLKERKNLRIKNILISFFAIALGFLFAYFLGQWYSFIPGLVSDSVEGWALAKLAEVLPIVVTVIVVSVHFGDNLESLYLKGGNVRKSLLLGTLVLPLSFIQYLAMGGLSVNVSIDILAGWTPWLLLFAFSNAFMEELIFRGALLRKLEGILGERGALIQVSLVFALIHTALLPFMGLEMVIVFVLFLFVIGGSWGYVMQKSGNIWGAVLAHAVADILFVIIAFGVV